MGFHVGQLLLWKKNPARVPGKLKIASARNEEGKKKKKNPWEIQFWIRVITGWKVLTVRYHAKDPPGFPRRLGDGWLIISASSYG